MSRHGISGVTGYKAARLIGLRSQTAVRYPTAQAGVYVGRLAVRATGWCNVRTAAGTIQEIAVRSCTPLHRADGYAYADAYTPMSDQKGAAASPPQA
jgi:hypothetical protein